MPMLTIKEGIVEWLESRRNGHFVTPLSSSHRPIMVNRYSSGMLNAAALRYVHISEFFLAASSNVIDHRKVLLSMRHSMCSQVRWTFVRFVYDFHN